MPKLCIRALSALASCAFASASIAAVTIVPPNLAGNIGGAVQGSSAVSSRGASQYSINLAVPPGTAGMAPSLSLQYDSENRTDSSGVGWSIGGLSSISRCKRTLATDNLNHAVNLSAQDAYCLDGQRLIKISGTDGATAEYRTEVESFSRIKSFGTNAANGADSWTVETRSGQIMTYGGATGNASVPNSTSVKWLWLLARSQDQHGNYVSYQYQAPNVNGEHVVTQIRYTGNDNAALPAYNAVNFIYEARNDVYRGYFAGGALIQRPNRLHAIETRFGTAADGSGGALVRQWTLGYDYSATSGRSLVHSITDCDGAGHCLAPTNFAWTQRDPAANTFGAPGTGVWGGPAITFDPTSQSGPIFSQVGRKAIVVDFNGDGKADIVYNSAFSTDWRLCTSTGTAFSCTIQSGMPSVASDYFMVGDFNGDGRGDILIAAPANSASGWILCLSNGAGFNCTPFSTSVIGKGLDVNNYLIGDMNGDGRSDIVMIGPNNTSTFLCLSTGTGFGTCTAYAASGILYNESPGDSYVTKVSRLTGDFNGDGMLDVLQYQTSVSGTDPKRFTFFDTTSLTLYLAREDGTGLSAAGTTSTFNRGAFAPGSLPGWSPLGDTNGDGYIDLTFGAPAYDANDVQHMYSTTCYTGGGLHCTSIDVTGNVNLAGVNDVGPYDGTDVASVNAGLGTLRVVPFSGPTGITSWTPGIGASGFAGCLAADFNGDGVSDVACYNSTTLQWTVSLVGSGSYPDRLATITDGNGLVTSFSYKGLWQAGVHTAGALPAYPKQNAHPTTPVVVRKSVNAASGLVPGGQTLDTTYSYSGMRSDLRGRGSLGFETVTATDVPSNVVTVTSLSQDFPTIGEPTVVTKTASNGLGAVLSQQVNTRQSFQTAPGVLFPYVRTSTTTGHDLDGTPLPTQTVQVGTSGLTDGIDAFGNITSVTESVQDGADTFVSTTSCPTFDNRTTTTWILGLCLDKTVLKKAPGVSDVLRETAATYDVFGQPATVTVQPNDPALKLLTTYTPDPAYGVVSKVSQTWTDPLTAAAVSRDVVTNVYDARRRFALTVTNAFGQPQTYTYDDGNGQRLSLKDANQITTSWQYDGWGRKIQENRPDGTFSTMAYKTCVNTCGYNGTATAVTVTQHWATVGGVAEQMVVPSEDFFDPLGRHVFHRTWDYASNEVYSDQIYDERGRLNRTTQPQTLAQRNAGTFGWTIYPDRDDLGRPHLIQTTKADNTGVDNTTMVYSGLLTTTTDPNLHTRKVRLNGLGKPKQVTDALNSTTSYVYDPFGNLARTTDPAGNVVQMSYDKLGRQTQLIDPDLGTWTYIVDPPGRVRRQTDARLQVTTVSFDLLDRMTERLEPDLDSRFTYDSATTGIGRLAEAYTWIAATGTKDYRRVYTYDTLGREQQVTTTLDWDYSQVTAYNNHGQPASVTHYRNAVGGVNNLAFIEFDLAYNNQGAVSQVLRGGATTLWTLNTQNALGDNTLETLGNGLKVQHTYNPYTVRLETISSGSDNGAGGVTPTVQGDAYSYDSVGNLLSRKQWADNAGTAMNESFTYDALNRLHTAQVAGKTGNVFNFDVLGNITSKTSVGTYNYPLAGSARPHLFNGITGAVAGLTNPVAGYDPNGNLLNAINRAYVWSAANLPTSIDVLSNGTQASASQRYAFLYGPERQRTRQDIRAMSGATQGAIQKTIWFGGGVEKELDLVANTTRIRTYMPLGLGYVEEAFPRTNILPRATNPPNDRYFLKDHLGSLNVVVDGTGAVLQRMGYDAWGRRRGADGTEMVWTSLGVASAANQQDHTGYTGQEQLDDLGLVHLNGRVYDPMLGRMTSADPTVPDVYDLQSMNRASYVNNSPLGYTDPTGFFREGDPAPQNNDPDTQKTHDSVSDRLAAAFGFVTVVDNRTPPVTPTKSVSSPESNGTVTTKGPAGPGLKLSDAAHGILGAASFAPSLIGSVASATDGLLHLVEGNKAEAGIAFAAAGIGLVSDAGVARVGLKLGAELVSSAKGVAAEGKTVLGHFPEYKQLGESLSARTFNVPEAVWNKMSEAERWGANQKFLDRMISRGDQVILSTPLDKVRPGSYFARELEYMGSKGYVPSADGTRLIKP